MLTIGQPIVEGLSSLTSQERRTRTHTHTHTNTHTHARARQLQTACALPLCACTQELVERGFEKLINEVDGKSAAQQKVGVGCADGDVPSH